jgi:hypothetical protein
LRSCFIGGVLYYLLRRRPRRHGADSSQSFTATLQVVVKSLGLIWCTVGFADRIESSNRKLKPLPPDPFRHQDSAIAPLD